MVIQPIKGSDNPHYVRLDRAFDLYLAIDHAIRHNNAEELKDLNRRSTIEVFFAALQKSDANVFRYAAEIGAGACFEYLVMWVQQYALSAPHLLSLITATSPYSESGDTALHLALRNQHVGCIKPLFTQYFINPLQLPPEHLSLRIDSSNAHAVHEEYLDQIKTAINKPNKAQQTPLFLAAKFADPHTLQTLLDHGGDITVPVIRNRHGIHTVFTTARRAGKKENEALLRARLLEETKIAIDQANTERLTALLNLNELKLDDEFFDSLSLEKYVLQDKIAREVQNALFYNRLKYAVEQGDLNAAHYIVQECLDGYLPTQFTINNLDKAPSLTRAYIEGVISTEKEPLLTADAAETEKSSNSNKEIAAIETALDEVKAQAVSLEQRRFKKEGLVLQGVHTLITQKMQQWQAGEIKSTDEFKQACDTILQDARLNQLMSQERGHFRRARIALNILILVIGAFVISLIGYAAARRQPSVKRLFTGEHSFFATRSERTLGKLEVAVHNAPFFRHRPKQDEAETAAKPAPAKKPENTPADIEKRRKRLALLQQKLVNYTQQASASSNAAERASHPQYFDTTQGEYGIKGFITSRLDELYKKLQVVGDHTPTDETLKPLELSMEILELDLQCCFEEKFHKLVAPTLPAAHKHHHSYEVKKVIEDSPMVATDETVVNTPLGVSVPSRHSVRRSNS